VRVAIIGDTHMPRGTRRLPNACVECLREADLIIHTGDLTGPAVLEQLRGYAEVAAVHGNADEPAVRAILPALLELELNGARVAVIHDSGRREDRLGRLRRKFPGADAVIFGHSHLPLHEADDSGFQIFNPGSPTERRRAPHRSMGILDVDAGALTFASLVVE